MAVAGSSCQGKGMGDAKDRGSVKDGRAERLAAALRDNLKRRKAQARVLRKPVEFKPPEA